MSISNELPVQDMEQLESCLEDIGKTLKGLDATGLEQKAQALIQSLVAVKSKLSRERDPERKARLKKALGLMSLQLEQQRDLMTKRAFVAGQQLDSLLPPSEDLTYKRSKTSSTDRFTAKTWRSQASSATPSY